MPHAAMFGVKGNIALGGMLFCCQHLFHKSAWNPKTDSDGVLVTQHRIGDDDVARSVSGRTVSDLVAFTDGTWYARSAEIVTGPVFL